MSVLYHGVRILALVSQIGARSSLSPTAQCLPNFKLHTFRTIFAGKMSDVHVKCRYPNEYHYVDSQGTKQGVARFEVPSEYVPWSATFDSYEPVAFTAPPVLTASWADPQGSWLADPEYSLEAGGFSPAFNALDGKTDRRSHEGDYLVENGPQGAPKNPRGRTGIQGRGLLGKWGPNHAADPIVTRWKRDATGQIVQTEDKPVLQFVSIQRRDNGQWAIPGGMVDPGEQVSVTLKREFMEEAMDSTQASDSEKIKMEKQVSNFFKCGEQVYAGYVDDPRNTDNAWMETVAVLFHDETGDSLGRFKLKAGDDAKNLRWTDISSELDLYASHKHFIQKAAEVKGAFW